MAYASSMPNTAPEAPMIAACGVVTADSNAPEMPLMKYSARKLRPPSLTSSRGPKM